MSGYKCSPWITYLLSRASDVYSDVLNGINTWKNEAFVRESQAVREALMAFRRSRVRSASAPPIKSSVFEFKNIDG